MKIKKCIKQSSKTSNKGFTLIELLVVVLIIGILASIALPQYRKVKVKAEANTMLVNLKALAEAQHRYYLANNEYATKFSNLDIEFNGYPDHDCPSNFSSSDCLSNDKSYLYISGGSGHTSWVMFRDEKYYGSAFQHNHNIIRCYENGGNYSGLCTKIFNCTLYKNVGSNNYYNCPEL